MIQAKIIADSMNEFGNRITTFELIYPRIIHAELMTHRVLSRNAASSRAVPSKKLIEAVSNEPFVPIKFQKTHSGMQGEEVLTGQEEELAISLWLEARDYAVAQAKKMLDANITKQIVNRILEPYQYYKALVTATDLENFFALRAHEAAEIHIQKLAYVMLYAYNASTPKQLTSNDWHIPYGDNMILDIAMVTKMYNESEEGLKNGGLPSKEFIQSLQVKIATARCARVSYTVVGEEGKPDNYENDIKLHDRLATMGHYSPFEHCAKAMSQAEREMNRLVVQKQNDSDNLGISGNFRGFIQYRKTLKGENKQDNRVKK